MATSWLDLIRVVRWAGSDIAEQTGKGKLGKTKVCRSCMRVYCFCFVLFFVFCFCCFLHYHIGGVGVGWGWGGGGVREWGK